jgi:hypothetical protein
MMPGGILDSTNKMPRNLEARGFVKYNSIKKDFLVYIEIKRVDLMKNVTNYFLSLGY